MSRLVLATGIGHALIAAGHTMKGIEVFSSPAWRSLPGLLGVYARAGWYQGSVFFLSASLYAYQLSQRDPASWTTIDRAIFALTAAIYLGSSAWYTKNGDRSTGALTGIVGIMQSLCLTL